MEKIESVLYAKFHHIDHETNRVVEKIIDKEDAKNYVRKVISDLLIIPNTKKFKIRSKGTEVVSTLYELMPMASEVAATEESSNSENDLSSFAEIIANRLLKSEHGAKQRYEGNLGIEITKGSLLQALVETETGYCFILSKIEHKPYIDREDMVKHYGLPYEKITLKCATIELNEEFSIGEIKISDTGNTIAKYWSSDFLELDEFSDSEQNTKVAFSEINKVLVRNIKKISEYDYMFLKQKLLGYFDNNDSYRHTEMIEAVIDNYTPQSNEINVDLIKKKLEELPTEKNFDAIFNIDKKLIDKKSKQQIEISDDIELNFKKDIPDLKQRIKSDTENGIKLLKVYKINEKTYNLFKQD